MEKININLNNDIGLIRFLEHNESVNENEKHVEMTRRINRGYRKYLNDLDFLLLNLSYEKNEFEIFFDNFLDSSVEFIESMQKVTLNFLIEKKEKTRYKKLTKGLRDNLSSIVNHIKHEQVAFAKLALEYNKKSKINGFYVIETKGNELYPSPLFHKKFECKIVYQNKDFEIVKRKIKVNTAYSFNYKIKQYFYQVIKISEISKEAIKDKININKENYNIPETKSSKILERILNNLSQIKQEYFPDEYFLTNYKILKKSDHFVITSGTKIKSISKKKSPMPNFKQTIITEKGIQNYALVYYFKPNDALKLK